MKQATVKITGLCPYAQSKAHGIEKKARETAEAYEKRTWSQKAHVNKDGHVVIPGLAFKKSIMEAAKYASIPISGRGKATYTKNFKAGILCYESPIILVNDQPLSHSSLDEEGSPYKGEWIFVNSDGVSGSGKRVHRCFPVVQDPWSCILPVIIADDIIVKEIFERVLTTAGGLIGIGAFRVGNGSIWGRYKFEIIEWIDSELAA